MESKGAAPDVRHVQRKLAKAKLGPNKSRGRPAPRAESKHESKMRDVDHEVEEADLEWEALRQSRREATRSRNESSTSFEEGEITVGRSTRAKRICEGFYINWMNMRDADSGRVVWDSGDWSKMELFERERRAHIPKEILKCRAVSREINFSSEESLEDFRIVQRVFYNGMCMEEWKFKFGFVIPGSTNSWESTVVGAGEGNMISPDLLSGHVTIETSFHDGDLLVSKSLFRIFYV